MDRFSVDEVSRHCTVDDAWVIAGGLVYDVSTFLDAHPGGITITREYLGKDISSVISTNQIHKHSDNALEILEHYRIGCIGSDREEVSLPIFLCIGRAQRACKLTSEINVHVCVYRIVLNSRPGVYFLPEVLDPALIRDRRLIETGVK